MSPDFRTWVRRISLCHKFTGWRESEGHGFNHAVNGHSWKAALAAEVRLANLKLANTMPCATADLASGSVFLLFLVDVGVFFVRVFWYPRFSDYCATIIAERQCPFPNYASLEQNLRVHLQGIFLSYGHREALSCLWTGMHRSVGPIEWCIDVFTCAWIGIMQCALSQ